MNHYNARFYTNKGVEISNKKIECTPANIPDSAGMHRDGLLEGCSHTRAP